MSKIRKIPLKLIMNILGSWIPSWSSNRPAVYESGWRQRETRMARLGRARVLGTIDPAFDSTPRPNKYLRGA